VDQSAGNELIEKAKTGNPYSITVAKNIAEPEKKCEKIFADFFFVNLIIV
jgi:hypothetical protein